MGISTEQLIAAREAEVDNASGFKAMISRLGQIKVAPPRITIPGISPEPTETLSPSTKMLLCMAAKGQRIYEGTVPPHVVARRRRRNRAARAARRVHRR